VPPSPEVSGEFRQVRGCVGSDFDVSFDTDETEANDFVTAATVFRGRCDSKDMSCAVVPPVFPLTLIEGIHFNVEYGTWGWRTRRLMSCDGAGSLVSVGGLTGVPTGAGVSETVSGQYAGDSAFGWELGLG
jgi:hypothetical protein